MRKERFILKIGLIVETSQLFRMPVIEEELRRAAERYGHEVFNYTNDTTYAKNGLLGAVLLNSGAVDLVVTGCGTGVGAIVAANSFIGVQCGFVADPCDAQMVRELNLSNAVAMPFSKDFGNEGILNLRFCFDVLLRPMQVPMYITPETRKGCEEMKQEMDDLKGVCQTPIAEVIRELDAAYVREALDSPTFQMCFFENCRDPQLAELIREKLQ